ncbi:MAG: luciferase family protein [Rubrobacteraceae bacterium]
MDEELLKIAEREILSWPGVSKEEMSGGTGRGGFRVPPATVYRFGRRHIGHIHNTGVADVTFPKKVHDELISAGKASPHPAGFAGVVSYRIQSPEDVPDAIELFHRSYELAKAAAERRGALQDGRSR